MERNEEKMKRQSKVMSIIALAVCVVGLTIGFAAFSNTLTIKSGATVTPNASDFQVGFSTTANSLTTGTITPTKSGSNSSKAGFVAPSIAIDNTMTDGKISLGEIEVGFTDNGQSALYEFYVYNSGKYTAYLNEIEIGGYPNCETVSGNNNALLMDVCDGIVLVGTYFTVYNVDGTLSLPSSYFGNGTAPTYTIYNELGDNSIDPGESQKIELRIEYPEGAALIDEPITITYPEVKLLYESVQGNLDV